MDPKISDFNFIWLLLLFKWNPLTWDGTYSTKFLLSWLPPLLSAIFASVLWPAAGQIKFSPLWVFFPHHIHAPNSNFGSGNGGLFSEGFLFQIPHFNLHRFCILRVLRVHVLRLHLHCYRPLQTGNFELQGNRICGQSCDLDSSVGQLFRDPSPYNWRLKLPLN